MTIAWYGTGSGEIKWKITVNATFLLKVFLAHIRNKEFRDCMFSILRNPLPVSLKRSIRQQIRTALSIPFYLKAFGHTIMLAGGLSHVHNTTSPNSGARGDHVIIPANNNNNNNTAPPNSKFSQMPDLVTTTTNDVHVSNSIEFQSLVQFL